MATFSTETLVAVWNKAQVVSGIDYNQRRMDVCGAWIDWSEYGKRDTDKGWEVDNILAIANGGGDSLSNLRPLHWKNNAKKSDGALTCPVKAK